MDQSFKRNNPSLVPFIVLAVIALVGFIAHLVGLVIAFGLLAFIDLVVFVGPDVNSHYTITSDGLLEGRGISSISQTEIKSCIYRSFIATGVKSFATFSFALYKEGDTQGLAYFTVPTTRWSPGQRRAFFGAFANWLAGAKIVIDDKTRQRLQELQS